MRGARGRAGGRGGKGAAASADGRLPLTPVSPLSPGRLLLEGSELLLSQWGTMVAMAGLHALCGVPGRPGETSVVPQLGSPAISKVCPWNSSDAAAKSLIHQKLSLPTTWARAGVEGRKWSGNSRTKALTE